MIKSGIGEFFQQMLSQSKSSHQHVSGHCQYAFGNFFGLLSRTAMILMHHLFTFHFRIGRLIAFIFHNGIFRPFDVLNKRSCKIREYDPEPEKTPC